MSEERMDSRKKWASPGSPIFTGTRKVETLKISLLTYDKQDFSFTEIASPEELPGRIAENKVNWINITGLHDTEKIDAIGKLFGIHPLVIEDILNVNHSPKCESYSDYIFVITKMIDLNRNKGLNVEQVSFILARNYIISFQEDEEDVFNVIRERLKNNESRVRNSGADYLLYRLLDAIVDNYYLVVESIENKIEAYDNLFLPGHRRSSLRPVYQIRKELMRLRRSVFPLQETIHVLEKERGNFVSQSTYLFLRDLSDHLRYIIDSIESHRDMITVMIEMYMSAESRKLNEIIKVLTVISTIFIPLTFIVGVYGMNFNPNTSKWNLPELNWMYGYPMVWIIMLAIAGGLIFYFKKKKWF